MGAREAWTAGGRLVVATTLLAACKVMPEPRTDGPAPGPPPAGQDAGAPLASDAGTDGALPAPAADGGAGPGTPVDGGAGADANPGTVLAVCPTVGSGPPILYPPDPPPARVPTPLPFTCNPLPRTFIFPSPALGPSTQHTRCASFSLGGTAALALSPDGHLAAMINGDGIARVVDVASQQVIAALAPARASVTRAGFSPSGDTVLTVAGTEHEATLWRTDGWTPIWTVTLPGHTDEYMDGAGFVTFSPDGQRVLASPGTGLSLLDVATGAVLGSYPSIAMMDAAYAWGGRRVVAADAILTGHCVRSPFGGSVVLLDPDTLAKLGSVTSWAGYSTDLTTPAFRASPTEDIVFVPPGDHDADQSVKAFRASDGSPLPPTGMTSLPLGFMPDGASLLVSADGELRLVRRSDGAIVARTTESVALGAPVAVSHDSSTVAVGASGPDLLHVWDTRTSYALGVCTMAGATPGYVVISGDGRLAAFTVGQAIQVVRPEDGVVVATLNSDNGDYLQHMALSRTGRYVAVMAGHLAPGAGQSITVVNVGTNGLVASLSSVTGPAEFMFAPDERSLYVVLSQPGGTNPLLGRIDLEARGPMTSRPLPTYVTIAGFSRGCPVLFDQRAGAYRSCDSCDEEPIPAAYTALASGVVVSPDGEYLATRDPYPDPTATLWSLPPIERALQSFAPPVDPEAVDLVEAPLAIAAYGQRMVVAPVVDNPSCYAGPGFMATVMENGKVIEQLPAGGAAGDEHLDRIASGAQIWCQ